MSGRVQRTCQICGSNVGFTISDDGFYYCGYCNSQADDIFDTGVDEEQLFSHYSASCTRVRQANNNVIYAEPISQVKPTISQYLDHPDAPTVDVDDVGDGVGPTVPTDFGSSRKNISYEEYCSEIRSRYLTGFQTMIQLQCKALVEKFNVTPLIVGLIGPVWLRYLASTGITADEWADRAIYDSEAQTQGEAEEFQPSAKYRALADPVNIHGKRVVYVWFRSLKSRLPLSSTLAITFLLCHVAREPIMPTDMLKWALEGKLPYFAVFSEIEKHLGPTSDACPIRASRMFRPIQIVSSQKLESMAADVANIIGLELPQVNFYAIASRYLRQLSLPIVEILPFACRVFEWSSPPELYLSTNEFRNPTRVCVMSILIVAIRILFDINGYGMWESSLSNPTCSSSPVEIEETRTTSHVPDTGLNVMKLLRTLEANYDELEDVPMYSDDLKSYLEYCKDVVFSGLKPSYEDLEEEKLLKELWDFYTSNKDIGTLDNGVVDPSKQEEDKKTKRVQNASDNTSQKDEVVSRLKLDMDENKFCYIAPRIKVKNKDYLHYARRRKDVYIYAVHADYYILLRSCAKVAQVETRVMHMAVLSLERRLQWLEKRSESLSLLESNFNDDCVFCKDENEQNVEDDCVDLNGNCEDDCVDLNEN